MARSNYAPGMPMIISRTLAVPHAYVIALSLLTDPPVEQARMRPRSSSTRPALLQEIRGPARSAAAGSLGLRAEGPSSNCLHRPRPGRKRLVQAHSDE